MTSVHGYVDVEERGEVQEAAVYLKGFSKWEAAPDESGVKPGGNYGVAQGTEGGVWLPRRVCEAGVGALVACGGVQLRSAAWHRG